MWVERQCLDCVAQPGLRECWWTKETKHIEQAPWFSSLLSAVGYTLLISHHWVESECVLGWDLCFLAEFKIAERWGLSGRKKKITNGCWVSLEHIWGLVEVKPAALLFPYKLRASLRWGKAPVSLLSLHVILKFSCQERWQGWHYNCNDNKMGQKVASIFKRGPLQLSSWTAVRGPMASLQTQQCSWSCATRFGKLHPEVNSKKMYKLRAQTSYSVANCLTCQHYAAHTNIFQIKRSLSPFTLPTGIFKIRRQS